MSSETTNSAFHAAPTVTPCSSPADTGCVGGNNYKVVLVTPTPAVGVSPYTTITVKSKAGTGGSMAYTSFTLAKDSQLNPPTVSNLSNRAIQLGVETYQTRFVVGDLDSMGMEDLCPKDVNGDPDCSMSTLDFSAESSNPSVLTGTSGSNPGITIELMPPDEGLETDEGPRSFLLTATPTGTPGRATITLFVTDQDGNTTTTSFIFKAVANSNVPPAFGSTDLSLEQQDYSVGTAPSKVHTYTLVSGDSTLTDLRVTAISSNTALVPNDSTHLAVASPAPTAGGIAAGTVTIVPATPIPAPSPGVPQSATITLSTTDDQYTRQKTFLYVVGDPASPAQAYSRPAGVYTLNAKATSHRANDAFLTGEEVAAKWGDIEVSPDEFDWSDLEAVLANFPATQSLSLNIQQGPCYLTSSGDLQYDAWCDTNSDNEPFLGACMTGCSTNTSFKRPVPWDSYLWQRREIFLDALIQELSEKGVLGKVKIVNPNLPGGEAGIRKVSVSFSRDNMDGYSRPHLLMAIQHELRTVQDKFPSALVQIGFFIVLDDEGPGGTHGTYTDELWPWLFKDATSDVNAVDDDGVRLFALADEFDGHKRPRISFFQETLAAARQSGPVPLGDVSPTPTPTPPARSSAPNYLTPPNTAAYTFTPDYTSIPSFAFFSGTPTSVTYNSGTVFSSNAEWSNPAMDGDGAKLAHTINGSPNDALEATFNAFNSQYLEVYLGDIDEAQTPVVSGPTPPPTLNADLWAGQLKSWHDYAATRDARAPIEPPAGLSVARTSSGQNTISWKGVYGATVYEVKAADLGTTISWIDASGCGGGSGRTSDLQCTDTVSSTLPRLYRVRAYSSYPDGKITDWSYVALFFSEGVGTEDNDGYVSYNGSMYSAVKNATEPGIWAGVSSNTTYKGFLSFVTSGLSGAAIQGAKLRLDQGTGTTAAGPAKVAISKGSFSNNRALQTTDYGWTSSLILEDAARVKPLSSTGWVEAELLPNSWPYINNSTMYMGRTQFRLTLDGAVNGQLLKWYAGNNVATNPATVPQLIVRYKP